MQLRKGNLLKLWVHKWIKYQHRTVHPFKSTSTFWLLIFNEGKRKQRERHEKHFYSLLRCGNLSISLSPSVPLSFCPSPSPSFFLSFFLKWSVDCSHRISYQIQNTPYTLSSFPALTFLVQGLICPHLEHFMNLLKGLISMVSPNRN